MPQGRVHVGTSGYVYDHWKGPFYPEDLPRKAWFRFYAERFSSVEINNTFYRLPDEATVARWRDEAPPGFVYAFKASRYVTHRKRLRPGGSYPHALETLVHRLEGAGDRLGPILFQTPPGMRRDDERLRAFLARLPRRDVRYAFEFRDASWHDEAVYDLLGEHGVAFCLHDWPDAPTPPSVVTADLVYVRFHGPRRAYAGLYGPRRMEPWAQRVARWRGEGREVLCFFNNDEKAYATRDAAWLARRLGVDARAPAAQ